MNTTMLETYVHLSNTDLDDEIMEREGIVAKNQGKSGAMAPNQCMNCLSINPATNNFCALCGHPLSDKARLGLERIKSEIEKLPEYRNLVEMLVKNLA
jgi:hypothetical protein